DSLQRHLHQFQRARQRRRGRRRAARGRRGRATPAARLLRPPADFDRPARRRARAREEERGRPVRRGVARGEDPVPRAELPVGGARGRAGPAARRRAAPGAGRRRCLHPLRGLPGARTGGRALVARPQAGTVNRRAARSLPPEGDGAGGAGQGAAVAHPVVQGGGPRLGVLRDGRILRLFEGSLRSLEANRRTAAAARRPRAEGRRAAGGRRHVLPAPGRAFCRRGGAAPGRHPALADRIESRDMTTTARRSGLPATTNVLILLCAMYFISYIVRQNVSTAIIAIRPEFKLSNTQAGLIFSAFGYPYLLFQIIGGVTADRFGPRRTLFLSGLVWAGATVLTSFAWDFYSLFFFRILMGFGVGATLPTATRAMQYWVESRKRGFAQGITHAFSRLGNALTPMLVVWLMAVVTWRGSFVVVGLAGFIWVGVWYWYFRDNPKDHPSITQAELDVLPQAPKGARPAVPWGPLIARMWPVTLTYFCYGWCLWLYLSFLLIFFKDTFSLSNSDAALFSTMVYFIGAIGNTAGGMISDRLLHRSGNV